MERGNAEQAVIRRRWTDELTRASSSGGEVTTIQEERQLKQLYESPNNSNAK